MIKLNNSVCVATEKDVFKIYEFAKGRYEESRINGPDIKLPWWRQNPNIFYVIHDKQGCVQANINLLPLRADCYQALRQGEIGECDIQPKDIYTPAEKNMVHHIYVEGFNCKNNRMVYCIIVKLNELLCNISDTNSTSLVIGAIGGTKEGSIIMRKLGFEIVSSGKRLLDKNFFEINYQAFVDFNSTRFNIND